MVKDINPNGAHSSPSNLTNANGTLFFVADDGVHGKALWKSDGTANGTVLVKDVNPDPNTAANTFFSNFTAFNGQLFFSAYDGTHGVELWKSDGTGAGTVMIELVPGPNSAGLDQLKVIDGALYFTAADPNSQLGWALYRSDGSAAGTHPIHNSPFAEFLAGLAATQGNDTLTGTAFADIIDGFGGDDTLTSLGGGDILRGGDGDDTAVLPLNLAQYAVQDLGDRIVVAGPDGTTTLTGIEHLQFADGTITPDHANPLFDKLYYLNHNVDVFHAGVDPWQHFLTFGWHEGRDPNALFDTSGYLAINKDVAAAGINPLDHYHQSGWHEGRDPSGAFDTLLYLIHNPDVAAAGTDPLAQYLASGRAEGRAIYPAVGNVVGDFDAQYYLWHNPDVAAAGVDPLQHYNTFGWHEGRNPNAWFDSAGYLSHYTDVAAAGVNPLLHYRLFGWHEGRDPSANFDTLGYLAANPDVAAAGVDPLAHYLHFGIYEGRAVVNDGAWH
jgi:ELWxxDGT repeat protein